MNIATGPAGASGVALNRGRLTLPPAALHLSASSWSWACRSRAARRRRVALGSPVRPPAAHAFGAALGSTAALAVWPRHSVLGPAPSLRHLNNTPDNPSLFGRALAIPVAATSATSEGEGPVSDQACGSEEKRVKEKLEKQERKRQKKARKMQAEAESRTGDMPESIEDDQAAVAVLAAAQNLLELQTQAIAQERLTWQKEREVWERNQSRLLDLVETLTARIVELSTSGGGGSGSLEAEKLRAKAASPASSSPSAPPSMPEVKAESTAKVKAESMPQVKAEPKPILGGRSPALDILDAIEEVNRRMFGSNGRRQEVPKQEGSTPQASEKAEEETAPVNEIADVEVVDTSKGQPVVLKYGDDDIYWVNQLQAALLRAGLYCGEEEMEEWIFGHQTQTALITYQAMEHLPETGVCDMESWERLLGPGYRHVTKDEMPPDVQEAAQEANARDGGYSVDGNAQDFFSFLKGDESEDGKESAGVRSSQGSDAAPAGTCVDPKQKQPGTSSSDNQVMFVKWPILRLDDGNRAVHHLQAALDKAGFGCDEDEMRWWMFGDSTQSSLSFFQACNGLPETGIADEATWKKLLGDPNAVPNDILKIATEDSFDEDLTDGGYSARTGKRPSDTQSVAVEMTRGRSEVHSVYRNSSPFQTSTCDTESGTYVVLA